MIAAAAADLAEALAQLCCLLGAFFGVLAVVIGGW